MPCYPPRNVPPYCHPAARAQSSFPLREAVIWDAPKEHPPPRARFPPLKRTDFGLTKETSFRRSTRFSLHPLSLRLVQICAETSRRSFKAMPQTDSRLLGPIQTALTR